MMDIITKLIKSRRRTADGIQFRGEIVDLAQELINFCEQNYLRIGRYQERSGDGRITVRWVVYQGRMADTFDGIDPAQVVESVVLTGLEGSTRRCDAYQQLAILLESLRRRIDG
jgi:hypothetical protein